MKAVHALAWYFPDSTGGSEVYVDGLTRELTHRGVDSVVAAAREGENDEIYRYNGVPIFRYPLLAPDGRDDVRGVVPHSGFERFARWLDSQAPDVYHQHSWSRGCGLHHLRYAKQLGLATVLTVHVPSVLCLRGSMMRLGHEPCDGWVEEKRCAGCWAAARGIAGPVATVLANMPRALSALADHYVTSSRLATALATRALVAAHAERIQELGQVADRVVVVCQWLYDAMARNGLSPQKMRLCRQGVAAAMRSTARANPESGVCTIGFLGRWDALKGIHILVQAIRRLDRNVPVELVVHGMDQGAEGDAYRKRVQHEAMGDPRIVFRGAVAREDLPGVLAGFDILAIPSLCMETGPLVALEALAAGVPVLGSDLGGISELVRPGENGWLVPPGDVSAWAEALRRLCGLDGARPKRVALAEPVRTMSQVAEEMAALYAELVPGPMSR